ncbi:hypothetical protein AJ79_01076 [Helicocarpus griseus UAMH5409]|uniref:6-phosphogluconolactonase n=1 Tax=Helicocarpus griseus UAMH5409 TaxID=1447875 RepID=A0A2B7Y7K4_9EURO|nr:hypothetical protein AJ79_01076 [Helicocarpus griseus UAMH5409]
MACFSKLFQAVGLTMLAQQVLAAQLYALHYTDGVHQLEFSEENGLNVVSVTVHGSPMLAWLTWDHANRNLYGIDEADGGLISWAAAEDNTLTETANVPALGSGVSNALYGGADGDGFLANAHYSTSAITTFKLPLGADSAQLQEFTYTMDGPGPNPGRQEAPHPHHIIPDPTGTFLVAPDLGADILRTYAVNKESGELTDCGGPSTQPGAGPRHAVFWTGASSRVNRRQGAGTKLFIADELSKTVSRWAVAYNGASGCPDLTLEQTLTPYADNATAIEGTKVGEIKVFGNHLYISNRNDKSFGEKNCSLSHYTLSETGEMTWSEISPAHGWYPRTFDINAAGDLVAIGDQTTSNVAIVKRDVETGKLGDLVGNLRIGVEGTPESEDGLSAVLWIDEGA